MTSRARAFCALILQIGYNQSVGHDEGDIRQGRLVADGNDAGTANAAHTS